MGRYRLLRRHISCLKKWASAGIRLLDNGAKPLIAAGQGTVAMLDFRHTIWLGGKQILLLAYLGGMAMP